MANSHSRLSDLQQDLGGRALSMKLSSTIQHSLPDKAFFFPIKSAGFRPTMLLPVVGSGGECDNYCFRSGYHHSGAGEQSFLPPHQNPS